MKDARTETTSMTEIEKAISEYVVISEEDALKREPLCASPDIDAMTDAEELKAKLRDEVSRNKRFLGKLKDLSKKYRRALKTIEFQDLLIAEMTSTLENEKENSRNLLLNEDFAHIAYGSLRIEECEEHDLLQAV